MDHIIGVIGAGTMGNGIAQAAASSGFKVILNDISTDLLDRGTGNISKSLDRFVKKETITENQKTEILGRIEKEYVDRPDVTLDHLDGLTVTHDDWWFNVRPSNTEPLLRLNAEAADAGRVAELRDEVLATIRSGS